MPMSLLGCCLLWYKYRFPWLHVALYLYSERYGKCTDIWPQKHKKVQNCVYFFGSTEFACIIHYEYVRHIITVTSEWAWWRLKSPASRVFTQPFIQVEIKESIKAPRHWSLWGEFTGDRWISRTKVQIRGKGFHMMTSSWNIGIITADNFQLGHTCTSLTRNIQLILHIISNY